MRRSEHLELVQQLKDEHAADRAAWAEAAAAERRDHLQLIEGLVAELAGMPRSSVTVPAFGESPGFDTEDDEIQRENQRIAQEIEDGLRARGLSPDPLVAS